MVALVCRSMDGMLQHVVVCLPIAIHLKINFLIDTSIHIQNSLSTELDTLSQGEWTRVRPPR